MTKVVAVSGGFDPIHIGHVRMFKEAKALGDTLVVILNNDAWLRAKKGFAFMPEAERAEIIREFPYVDAVVITNHAENDTDRSVNRALRSIRPHIFANGGDRKAKADIPEAAVCDELGIKMVFNVGKGGKVQSSSWLTDNVRREETHRSAGVLPSRGRRKGPLTDNVRREETHRSAGVLPSRGRRKGVPKKKSGKTKAASKKRARSARR
ncbi:MAG: adenylyltransferase/cytidyltransferase family protein [Patescibacteria group bacterium]|nr:adenylyltransferase/cytidyltransferase family protein [Patescibacteria group bacterium]